MKLNLLQMAAKQTFENNMFKLDFGKYFTNIVFQKQRSGIIISKNGRVEVSFPHYGGLQIRVEKIDGTGVLYELNQNFFNSELQHVLREIYDEKVLDLESVRRPIFTEVPTMPYFSEAMPMPKESKFTKQELKRVFCVLIFFFASFFLLIKILKLCI